MSFNTKCKWPRASQKGKKLLNILHHDTKTQSEKGYRRKDKDDE